MFQNMVSNFQAHNVNHPLALVVFHLFSFIVVFREISYYCDFEVVTG